MKTNANIGEENKKVNEKEKLKNKRESNKK